MGRYRDLGAIAHGAVFIEEVATAAQVNDGRILTLNDKIYEFDDDAMVTPGNISVTIAVDGVGSAAATILNLVNAINGNQPTVPMVAYVDPINPEVCRIEANDKGAAGNVVFTTTIAEGNSDISGAGNLEDGDNDGTQTLHHGTYLVDDVDIDAGSVQINTGLQTIADSGFAVQVRGSTGVIRANDDFWTVRANKYIQAAIQAGVPLVAGDIISWWAWE